MTAHHCWVEILMLQQMTYCTVRAKGSPKGKPLTVRKSVGQIGGK